MVPTKNISSVCLGTDMYMVIKSWTLHYCKHSSKSFRKMGSSKVLNRAEDNVPWQSCEGNIYLNGPEDNGSVHKRVTESSDMGD